MNLAQEESEGGIALAAVEDRVTLTPNLIPNLLLKLESVRLLPQCVLLPKITGHSKIKISKVKLQLSSAHCNLPNELNQFLFDLFVFVAQTFDLRLTASRRILKALPLFLD